MSGRKPEHDNTVGQPRRASDSRPRPGSGTPTASEPVNKDGPKPAQLQRRAEAFQNLPAPSTLGGPSRKLERGRSRRRGECCLGATIYPATRLNPGVFYSEWQLLLPSPRPSSPMPESNPSAWSATSLRRAISAAGVALWSWNVETDAFAMDERGFQLWAVPQSGRRQV